MYKIRSIDGKTHPYCSNCGTFFHLPEQCKDCSKERKTQGGVLKAYDSFLRMAVQASTPKDNRNFLLKVFFPIRETFLEEMKASVCRTMALLLPIIMIIQHIRWMY